MNQNGSSILHCAACSANFDATAAAWCNCVTTRATLLCPRCTRCACMSGPAAVRQFWQELPRGLRDMRRDVLKHRSHEAGRSNAGAEILVVDDDEEIRLAAAFLLEDMGYPVRTTGNPEEVLKIVEMQPPRMVLTDALMPKMDGRVLCRLIKACDANVKVVVMTSLYTSPRYKYEALKDFRADGYLAKPIALPELRELMTRFAPLPVAASKVTA